MIPEAEKLDLMIVTAETFTRAQLLSAAEESNCFATPVIAEDGYEALALLWDAWECGHLPDVVVADIDLAGCSATQFTYELRQHEETRRLFVAILSPDPADCKRSAGADYFAEYSAFSGDLVEKFQAIGRTCCGNAILSA